MFPLRWNFPFRKKDGSMSTIEEVISEGGGGGGYTLPTASAETKGGIKIGSGLVMDGETLNNTNPTPYSLPVASDETLGGVKVGTGLSIDENGVLSSSGGSTYLPTPYELTLNVFTSGKLRLYKLDDKTVLVCGMIKAVNGQSGDASVLIGSVPSGYIPKEGSSVTYTSTLTAIARSSNGNPLGIALASIINSGQITIKMPTSSTSIFALDFGSCYTLDPEYQ